MSSYFEILSNGERWAVDCPAGYLYGYKTKQHLMRIAFEELKFWEIGFCLDQGTLWVSQEAYSQVGDNPLLARSLFYGQQDDGFRRVVLNTLDEAESFVEALEKLLVFNLLKQSYAS